MNSSAELVHPRSGQTSATGPSAANLISPFEIVRQGIRRHYYMTDVCVICQSDEPAFVFLPCRHACVCCACSTEFNYVERHFVSQAGDFCYRVCANMSLISTCPMCRADIKVTKRMC
jgi:hypothetical protein